MQYEMIQKEKEERKQEKIRKQEERIEAVKKSKQERLLRIKKLTQKTKKVMTTNDDSYDSGFDEDGHDSADNLNEDAPRTMLAITAGGMQVTTRVLG